MRSTTMLKRIASILLVVAMVFGTFPATVFAQTPEDEVSVVENEEPAPGEDENAPGDNEEDNNPGDDGLEDNDPGDDGLEDNDPGDDGLEPPLADAPLLDAPLGDGLDVTDPDEGDVEISDASTVNIVWDGDETAVDNNNGIDLNKTPKGSSSQTAREDAVARKYVAENYAREITITRASADEKIRSIAMDSEGSDESAMFVLQMPDGSSGWKTLDLDGGITLDGTNTSFTFRVLPLASDAAGAPTNITGTGTDGVHKGVIEITYDAVGGNTSDSRSLHVVFTVADPTPIEPFNFVAPYPIAGGDPAVDAALTSAIAGLNTTLADKGLTITAAEWAWGDNTSNPVTGDFGVDGSKWNEGTGHKDGVFDEEDNAKFEADAVYRLKLTLEAEDESYALPDDTALANLTAFPGWTGSTYFTVNDNWATVTPEDNEAKDAYTVSYIVRCVSGLSVFDGTTLVNTEEAFSLNKVGRVGATIPAIAPGKSLPAYKASDFERTITIKNTSENAIKITSIGFEESDQYESFADPVIVNDAGEPIIDQDGPYTLIKDATINVKLAPKDNTLIAKESYSATLEVEAIAVPVGTQTSEVAAPGVEIDVEFTVKDSDTLINIAGTDLTVDEPVTGASLPDLTTIQASYAADLSGATPDPLIREFDITGLKWYEYDDVETKWDLISGAHTVSNKKYKVELDLTPRSGYKFADTHDIDINGTDATKVGDVVAANGVLTVSSEFAVNNPLTLSIGENPVNTTDKPIVLNDKQGAPIAFLGYTDTAYEQIITITNPNDATTTGSTIYITGIKLAGDDGAGDSDFVLDFGESASGDFADLDPDEPDTAVAITNGVTKSFKIRPKGNTVLTQEKTYTDTVIVEASFDDPVPSPNVISQVPAPGELNVSATVKFTVNKSIAELDRNITVAVPIHGALPQLKDALNTANGLTAPAPGDGEGETDPSDKGYYISNAVWTWGTDVSTKLDFHADTAEWTDGTNTNNGVYDEGYDGPFEYGENYQLVLTLAAKEGYALPDAAALTAAAEAAVLSYPANSYFKLNGTLITMCAEGTAGETVTVTYVFDAAETIGLDEIKKPATGTIDITVPAPAVYLAGKSGTDPDVPDAAYINALTDNSTLPFNVADATWKNFGGTGVAAFQQHGIYDLELTIAAKGGYAFLIDGTDEIDNATFKIGSHLAEIIKIDGVASLDSAIAELPAENADNITLKVTFTEGSLTPALTTTKLPPALTSKAYDSGFVIEGTISDDDTLVTTGYIIEWAKGADWPKDAVKDYGVSNGRVDESREKGRAKISVIEGNAANAEFEGKLPLKMTVRKDGDASTVYGYLDTGVDGGIPFEVIAVGTDVAFGSGSLDFGTIENKWVEEDEDESGHKADPIDGEDNLPRITVPLVNNGTSEYTIDRVVFPGYDDYFKGIVTTATISKQVTAAETTPGTGSFAIRLEEAAYSGIFEGPQTIPFYVIYKAVAPGSGEPIVQLAGDLALEGAFTANFVERSTESPRFSDDTVSAAAKYTARILTGNLDKDVQFVPETITLDNSASQDLSTLSWSIANAKKGADNLTLENLPFQLTGGSNGSRILGLKRQLEDSDTASDSDAGTYTFEIQVKNRMKTVVLPVTVYVPKTGNYIVDFKGSSPAGTFNKTTHNITDEAETNPELLIENASYKAVLDAENDVTYRDNSVPLTPTGALRYGEKVNVTLTLSGNAKKVGELDVSFFTGEPDATGGSSVMATSPVVAELISGDLEITKSGPLTNHKLVYEFTMPNGDMKDLQIKVGYTAATNDAVLDSDLAALSFDDIKGDNKNENLVENNLALIDEGASGLTSITWASNNQIVNKDSGVVTRAEALKDDTSVTLTATLTIGSGASAKSKTKDIRITVKKYGFRSADHVVIYADSNEIEDYGAALLLEADLTSDSRQAHETVMQDVTWGVRPTVWADLDDGEGDLYGGFEEYLKSLDCHPPKGEIPSARATINQSGLLVPTPESENGFITVTATAKDGSGVVGTYVVLITGQKNTAITGITTSLDTIYTAKKVIALTYNGVDVDIGYVLTAEAVFEGSTPPSTETSVADDEPPYDPEIRWFTSNSKVAVIDRGTAGGADFVRGVSEGKTKIRVVAKDLLGKETVKEFDVEVKPIVPETVDVNTHEFTPDGENLKLEVGKTINVSAVVYGKTGLLDPATATDPSVTPAPGGDDTGSQAAATVKTEAKAADQRVTWTGDDNIRLASNGVSSVRVTALTKADKVTLTAASVADDKKSGKVDFAIEPMEVNAVTINKGTPIVLGIREKHTVALTAPLRTDAAAMASLEWKSSDNTKVRVDQNGVLTAEAATEDEEPVTITVTSTQFSGEEAPSDTVTVTVKAEDVEITSAWIDLGVLGVGERTAATAIVPDNAPYTATISWIESASKAAASVFKANTEYDAIITLRPVSSAFKFNIAAGQLTIANSGVTYNKAIATTPATITLENVPIAQIPVNSVGFKGNTPKIRRLPSGTLDLKPYIEFNGGGSIPGNTALTWSSSNTGVATVLDGVVTFLALPANNSGTVEITAKSAADNTKEDTHTLHLYEAGHQLALSPPTISMSKDEIKPLTLSTVSGTVLDWQSLDRDDVQYTSSNNSVATVSPLGVVTATLTKGIGDATIMVRSNDYPELYAYAWVTVTATTEGPVITTPAQQNDQGQYILGTGEGDFIQLSASGDVTWKSNDTNVAKVDSTGKVIWGEKATGTTIITATNKAAPKTSSSVSVIVVDYTPRPSVNALTVRRGSDGTPFDLLTVTGSATLNLSSVTATSDKANDKAKIEQDLKVEVTNGQLFIKTISDTARGNYNVRFTSNLNNEDNMTSVVKVTVTDKDYKAKVKFTGSINPFYYDQSVNFTVTGSNLPEITDIDFADKTTNLLAKYYEKPEINGTVATLRMTDGAFTGDDPNPVKEKKGNLLITYSDKSTSTVSVTVPVKYAEPKLKITPTKQNINPDYGMDASFVITGAPIDRVSFFEETPNAEKVAITDTNRNGATVRITQKADANLGDTIRTKINVFPENARQALAKAPDLSVTLKDTAPKFRINPATVSVNNLLFGQEQWIAIEATDITNFPIELRHEDPIKAVGSKQNKSISVEPEVRDGRLGLLVSVPKGVEKANYAYEVYLDKVQKPLKFRVSVANREANPTIKAARGGRIDLLNLKDSFIEYTPTFKGLPVNEVMAVRVVNDTRESGHFVNFDTDALDPETGTFRLKASDIASFESGVTYSMRIEFVLDVGASQSETVRTKDIRVRPAASRIRYTFPRNLTLFQSRNGYDGYIDIDVSSDIAKIASMDFKTEARAGVFRNNPANAFWFMFNAESQTLRVWLKDAGALKPGKATLTFVATYEVEDEQSVTFKLKSGETTAATFTTDIKIPVVIQR